MSPYPPTHRARTTRRTGPAPRPEHRRPARFRLAAAGLAVALVGVVATGCAKEEPAAAGDGHAVNVVLTDGGCEPSPAKVEAGTTSFKITNDDAAAVSEAELKAGDGQSILGEKENLSPGLSGTFSLRLAEGTYKIYCPGAKQDTWTFTVAGGEKVGNWRDNPKLVKAVDAYDSYVTSQAADLLTKTKAFAAAVSSGDVEAAKAAYVTARIPYERIEPVAESFGDLDPRIDGRLGDNGDAPSDFLGFHRIEKALWVDNSLDGMAPLAATLVDDVTKLQALIDDKAGTYVPNEVTNGAVELMNEVLTSKITGEEERYSHLDLVDFQANFDGSMKTVDLLRPVLEDAAPDLVRKIDAAADRVQSALDELKADPGYVGSGFVEWSCAPDDSGELPEGCRVTDSDAATPEQRRTLTDAVRPLADLLAQVPVKVVR